MIDTAPEDILRMEQEAEHRQLEGEALVEAARDRYVVVDEERAERWGDYELCAWESTPGVEACFADFMKVMAEGDESLGRDEQAEESGIGTDIPEYLDWEYMEEITR